MMKYDDRFDMENIIDNIANNKSLAKTAEYRNDVTQFARHFGASAVISYADRVGCRAEVEAILR